MLDKQCLFSCFAVNQVIETNLGRVIIERKQILQALRDASRGTPERGIHSAAIASDAQ